MIARKRRFVVAADVRGPGARIVALVQAMVLWTAMVLPACGPDHGRFGPSAFQYPKYNYEVLYKEPSKQVFIDSEWVVDNWRYDTHPYPEWQIKRGKRYLGYRMVETEDGNLEKEETYLFDLKLVHKKTNGVIWIQTFDLIERDRKKMLVVLLNNYVDSLSGTGLYRQGSIYSLSQHKLRRYVAKVLSKKVDQRGPLDVMHALIEVVDLERKKGDESYRGERLKVIMTKVITNRGHLALLLAGYHNTGAQFDAYVEDFDAFIKNIRVTP